VASCFLFHREDRHTNEKVNACPKDLKSAVPLLLLLLSITLVACAAKPASEVESVIEHVRIDDAVIDRGNPYEIIDPVWWAGNIYEGEQKYNHGSTHS
jgi:hypothetical protein